jgi:glycosyltransferase involved in cell wall biosynthesis
MMTTDRTRLSIAHVLPSFALGGQEVVALDLSGGQRRAGCRVMSISLAGEGPMAAAFRERDVGVRLVAKRGGFDPSLFARLAMLFRRERVDLVHTHNPQPLIYAAPAARLAGAAAVHTRHGENIDSWRRRLLRRTSAAFTDCYVAVSDRTAERTRIDRDVDERKLVITPNGIDLSRYRPDAQARAAVRGELGIPADAWVVGTVGRVAPVKDHVTLVRAMAPRLSPERQLVIVGDGAAMPAVRAEVERLPGARFVHLPGARSDVQRLLAALDVFALSSIEEGLPLALLEAMASALPTVSTRVGGIPGVLVPRNLGLLVEPGDAEALGRALGTIAADPNGARAMGARAREVALAEYSAETMVERYFEIYERVLRSRGRRSGGGNGA